MIIRNNKCGCNSCICSPEPILQPFVNANLDTQKIASGANVVFSASPIETTVTGIAFNGADTFTILQPGLYYLNCTLNFVPGTPARSHFEILLNGNAPRAPGSNADTVGPAL
ncbi:hypothetical protein AR454_06215 [Bacillus mycoides]|uniref:hypothetical protein n=1 Tax=Bacillus mycoides TaxID=1405 RepID=UPI001E2AA831|nr:hypothetical protein [Bacillus mycoides]MCD4646597.1 hypothetical protein [Bacillus mycoides]